MISASHNKIIEGAAKERKREKKMPTKSSPEPCYNLRIKKTHGLFGAHTRIKDANVNGKAAENRLNATSHENESSGTRAHARNYNINAYRKRGQTLLSVAAPSPIIEDVLKFGGCDPVNA
jgi:hypothetical protein